MSSFRIENFYKLLSKTFNAPFFQRGYRWERQQVEDLLNDLAEFTDSGSVDSFYCLQPLAVKANGKMYDVIDGQQRLTTIYLLLKYLQPTREENCDVRDLYSISFERANDGGYLAEDKFSEDLRAEKAGEKDLLYPRNADSFFLFRAYKAIDQWFENGHKRYKTRIAQALTGELTPESDDDKKKDVRVIWYELGDSEDDIAAFTRLNAGKIQLTEAELIKALLFQCDCYSAESKPIYREISFRRSCEWDDMEKKLQNPLFWSMLVPQSYSPASHIDLIIAFVARKIKERDPALYPFSEDKDLFSFLVFDKYIKDSLATADASKKEQAMADVVSRIWKMIQDCFIVFNNWYGNRKTYHLIGLLTILRSKGRSGQHFDTLRSIYNLFTSVQNDKYAACDGLRRLIGDEIRISEKESDGSIVALGELSYFLHPKRIIKIMEAFNVYLYLNDCCHERIFQFDKFTQFNVTSLEHIHPQNLDTDNMTLEEVKSWFHGREDKIKDSEAKRSMAAILSEIENIEDEKKARKVFESYRQTIIENEKEIDRAFNELAGMDEGQMHSLYNLALVDKDTNSALSNHYLHAKKKILRDREANGTTYAPIGTHAAFGKDFSVSPTDLKFWSPDDRTAYFSEIEKAYNHFTHE